MFRLLWSAAKTYLTVKAVEAVTNAFNKPRSAKARTASAAKSGRSTAARKASRTSAA